MSVCNRLLLSLTMLFIVPFINAHSATDLNDYRLFITSSIAVESPSENKNFSFTSFQLSNNTDWYLASNSSMSGHDPFSDDLEVFIYPNLNAQLLELNDFLVRFVDENNKKKSIPCWLTSTSEKALPTIKQITKMSNGWFHYDYCLTLSDNSQWKISSDAQITRWKVGDFILISPEDPTYEKWILMNVNRKRLDLIKSNFFVSYCEGEIIP